MSSTDPAICSDVDLARLAGRVTGVACEPSTLAAWRQTVGGLRGVRRLGPGLAVAVGGLPDAAAGRLADALELARQAWLEEDTRVQVRGAGDVYGQFAALSAEPVEELWLLPLDGANRAIGRARVAGGSSSRLAATPADVLEACLRRGVTRFVLVHNHPSGVATPSREDVAFTRGVLRAARLLGVALLDHVVVGAGQWASLRDAGLVAFDEPGRG